MYSCFSCFEYKLHMKINHCWLNISSLYCMSNAVKGKGKVEAYLNIWANRSCVKVPPSSFFCVFFLSRRAAGPRLNHLSRTFDQEIVRWFQDTKRKKGYSSWEKYSQNLPNQFTLSRCVSSLFIRIEGCWSLVQMYNSLLCSVKAWDSRETQQFSIFLGQNNNSLNEKC